MIASDNQSKTTVTLARYCLETNVTHPLRLVQLTDLHGHVFGGDNEILVEMVREQNPDLILMTGDMIDKTDASADVVCALIENLCYFAPVYFGYGNHETSWMVQNGADLRPELEKAGAVVLDVEYLDLEVNGQEIRLGGYHAYYRQPGMLYGGKEQAEVEMAFADRFEDTDRYKILLSHIPTAWLDWGYIDKYPVNLVLSGHYHGGQIQIPLVGGLVAPYIGWFPEYTEGIFTGEQASCVLSTGLGSSPGVPRINNLPQIVVVDLYPNGH